MKITKPGRLMFDPDTHQLRFIGWHFDCEGKSLDEKEVMRAVAVYLAVHGRIDWNWRPETEHAPASNGDR